MVLVDTSVWVDYFNGVPSTETDLLDVLLESDQVLTGDLILAELLQGFARERDHQRARALLLTLPYADLAGREVALAASAHFRNLRRKGITVRKTIDMLIGSFCLLHGHELLHADRDFDPMASILGLRISRGAA